MSRRPVIYAGMVHGHLTSGEISRHEVAEFVESCQNAGWDSVVVAQGAKVIAKWRRSPC